MAKKYNSKCGALIKSSKNISSRIWLFALLILVTGCAHNYQATQFKTHSEALLEPTFFNVEIPSFDGTRIKATVYQPSLGPHETAPVIVHSHGFGFFRMARPLSLYGQFLFTGKASLNAWKKGYWVVSFDQRGHGASEGEIHVLDESYELKDLVYLLDWIENNIPRITYRDSDPVIGMIGESYAGGAQLLGSGLDSRIDAIVPVTTWNDFSKSLAPDQVPKTGWLTTLILTGNILNPGNMRSELNEGYRTARSGEFAEHLTDFLPKRSMSNRCDENNLEGSFQPKADALFIQGFRDVLFPVNEAVKNANCLKAHGRDVRIIATQDGHLLPFTQFSFGMPGHHIEEKVHCGTRQFKTIDLTLAWFDEKLKGIPGAADNIPAVCLTHDYDTGSVFTQVPHGGLAYEIPETRVSSGLAGLLEMPLGLFDKISSWILPRFTSSNNIAKHKRGGRFRPAFVPLLHADHDAMMAGIPKATIHVSSNKEKQPRLFVGIGIKNRFSREIELVSDQVFPIKGEGTHEIDLPAMSTRIQKGDVVGLVVSSYSNQYRLSGSGLQTQADIAGSIELPLFGVENTDNQYLVQAYTNN